MKMDENKQNIQKSEEANQIMSEKFKGYNAKTISAADTEIERTNQKIQQLFYENDEEKNYLPFYIDSNSPPMKK
jgi:hypothetical protein